MARFGCPERMLQTIGNLLDNNTAHVIMPQRMSPPFPINYKVRRGCVPVLTIFTVFTNAVIHIVDFRSVEVNYRINGCFFDLISLKAHTRYRK